MNEDDGERLIMSYPLTPNREKKYQFVDKSSFTMIQFDRELTLLNETFRKPKELKD